MKNDYGQRIILGKKFLKKIGLTYQDKGLVEKALVECFCQKKTSFSSIEKKIDSLSNILLSKEWLRISSDAKNEIEAIKRSLLKKSGSLGKEDELVYIYTESMKKKFKESIEDSNFDYLIFSKE